MCSCDTEWLLCCCIMTQWVVLGHGDKMWFWKFKPKPLLSLCNFIVNPPRQKHNFAENDIYIYIYLTFYKCVQLSLIITLLNVILFAVGACSGDMAVLTGSHGEFGTVGNSYGNNERCQWRIEVEEGQVWCLRLKNFRNIITCITYLFSWSDRSDRHTFSTHLQSSITI